MNTEEKIRRIDLRVDDIIKELQSLYNKGTDLKYLLNILDSKILEIESLIDNPLEKDNNQFNKYFRAKLKHTRIVVEGFMPLHKENRFEKYDKENPDIWKAFEKFTFQAIKRGFTHYSARAVFHIIRWHTAVEKRGQFKVNNNYSKQYALKFMRKYPVYIGFFRVRN